MENFFIALNNVGNHLATGILNQDGTISVTWAIGVGTMNQKLEGFDKLKSILTDIVEIKDIEGNQILEKELHTSKVLNSKVTQTPYPKQGEYPSVCKILNRGD